MSEKLTELDEVFASEGLSERLHRVAGPMHESARNFWRMAIADTSLTPRMKELLLLAMHATATSVNERAIARHVKRAVVAGASESDVIDVLVSVVGAANHALYFAVPILVEQLRHVEGEDQACAPLRADVEMVKARFVETRGFWNQERESIASLLPDYFIALSKISMSPWEAGSLTPKEREFIYIAIDCSVTHMYGPGLAMHIRNALRHGATSAEILAIFQLSALLGLEGYIMGAEGL
ncbi:carboxymuconolactone decarboxylase family protein [Parapusillimonas granuli]|uniref:Carboxymuconolactone decarboxylase family protein n=1 Tax=Parapusillimonas granuli TaxID=380911 RepID=A0A853G1D7_9BURK|nr:carboxymuconolactone decarboxylase family protein [Parapusillimonas granuli]MBB5215641.1 alkylhydroperoxidase/carboxymuconolactone decarboxylase family protein YurZ [Parapusillimonas granuli]NYT49692.1 carboxymuconolactone decarboxylase family protein [Parapusillimonas granuli]